jgi:hypothetical protein
MHVMLCYACQQLIQCGPSFGDPCTQDVLVWEAMLSLPWQAQYSYKYVVVENGEHEGKQVCVCVCARVCVYLHTHACVCASMQVSGLICGCVHVYKHVCKRV